MNILFVSEQVIPADGNAFTGSLLTFIQRYRAFGRLTCACYHRDPSVSALPSRDGINFLILRKENTLANKLPHHRYNQRLLAQAVERADYVIAHLPSAPGNIAIRLARQLRRVSIAGVVGCGFEALWYYNWKGRLVAPFSFLSMRRAVRRADHAFYVSQSYLQRRYPNPNPTMGASNVELEALTDDVLTRRLERIRRMDLTEGGRGHVACMGGIDVRYKGFQWAIEALARLGGPHFCLHLIGGGDPTWLRGVARKNGVEADVVFEGCLPHDQVFSLLDNMDVYLHPSLTEGVPRSLIEAVSRALPAYGSDIPGVREVLPAEACFPCRSVDDIVRLLSGITPQTLELQARRNFEKAHEFEAGKLKRKRDEFFRSIIKVG